VEKEPRNETSILFMIGSEKRFRRLRQAHKTSLEILLKQKPPLGGAACF